MKRSPRAPQRPLSDLRAPIISHLSLQEGELRPQLLDRFGMSVTVETLQDSKQRTQLVMDRLAYEKDPDALVESCRPEQVGKRVWAWKQGVCWD